MDDKKERSLIRSNELHQSGMEFIEGKKEIPIGMSDDSVKSYNSIKSKLITLYNATEEDWDRWQWQMRNRISTVDILERIIDLSDQEKEDINEISKKYRWAITPYYAAVIDPKNPNDAVKKMSIPLLDELSEKGLADPTGEEYTNPAGIITRRYPDRLILNVTNLCSSFCRHCQRRRKIKQVDDVADWEAIDASIKYVEDNPEIRDVLITGGDPLTMSDEFLDKILTKVRNIKHVEIIRVGSRTPVTMPQRITPELVNILKKHHPIFMNTQFNHPGEITPESAAACRMLRDNGIVLGNQMVLLKGINDCKVTVRVLNHEMLKIGVRPYYIFHAKNVIGTLHFQTPINTGTEIIEYLQGKTSGLAIPTYIVSAPNGLGKIPMNPHYVVDEDEESITLRTWENNKVKVPKHGY